MSLVRFKKQEINQIMEIYSKKKFQLESGKTTLFAFNQTVLSFQYIGHIA